MDLRYGAEALGLLFIAIALMKWVARNVRSQISESGASADAGIIDGFGEAASLRAAGALQQRGLVTSAQLAAMSPRERLLLLTSVRHLSVTGDGAPAPGAKSERAEPAERPLLSAVHCPACGTALDRQEIVALGASRCAGCGPRVSARVQRRRLLVAVDDERAAPAPDGA